MSAIVPPTVIIENFGDTTMHIATCSDITDASTWTSGIENVVGHWFQGTDDSTTASLNAVDVTLTTASTGLFTFHCEEANRVGKLFVMSQN